MTTLPTIVLEQKLHRQQAQLLIRFTYNKYLLSVLRSLQNVYWSSSLKTWYTKDTEENLALIFTAFKNKTHINSDRLYGKHTYERNLKKGQKELLNGFFKYLRGKRYSKSSIDTYTFFMADFINFYRDKELQNISDRDVEVFIEDVFIRRSYSISTQRQFTSALKLFLSYCPEIKINPVVLTRPKRSKKLPNILSAEEVISILQVTKNLKHRAIIALLYSSGLRVGEITNLKLSEIDIERNLVKVVSSKGRKDRFVVLAKSFLPLLNNYLLSYKPNFYFIEGLAGKKYSESSIRKFLSKNVALAGITKNVSPHTLRHSYATHLLENGVGIRHIQELLGHSRPETTMIYTHVAKKDLLEIQSPLDSILLSLEQNRKEEQKFLLSGNRKL